MVFNMLCKLKSSALGIIFSVKSQIRNSVDGVGNTVCARTEEAAIGSTQASEHVFPLNFIYGIFGIMGY